MASVRRRAGRRLSDGRPYAYAFGGDGTGTGVDLREPVELLDLCPRSASRMVCMTAGSPYY